MMDTHKYNELRHMVWMLWHHTVALMSKYEESGFKKGVDISYQQYLILHIMLSLGTPVTATDIADKVERNANSVSTMLDRMEKQGLVRKERDLPDRRLVRLEITPYGMEKFAQAAKIGWEIIERLMSSYSEEELKVLTQELAKLREIVFREVYPGQAVPDLQAEMKL